MRLQNGRRIRQPHVGIGSPTTRTLCPILQKLQPRAISQNPQLEQVCLLLQRTVVPVAWLPHQTQLSIPKTLAKSLTLFNSPIFAFVGRKDYFCNRFKFVTNTNCERKSYRTVEKARHQAFGAEDCDNAIPADPPQPSHSRHHL